MYCSSSSATHHIFFPPRLQVVALQQNPDCLPPRFGDQFAFDRFLDDQTHGPARPTFRRLTADHGNDTLLLGIVENWLRPRTLFVVERGLQAVAVVAVGYLADGLRGYRECRGDLRSGDSLAELTQS